MRARGHDKSFNPSYIKYLFLCIAGLSPVLWLINKYSTFTTALTVAAVYTRTATVYSVANQSSSVYDGNQTFMFA